jgi:cytochrome c peroxidase
MRETRWRTRWIVGASLAACGIASSIAAVHAMKTPAVAPGADVRQVILRDADSLDVALAALSDALATLATRSAADSVDVRHVRSAFRRARSRYKRVEAVVEFYAPALAAAFNSRRQEVDDEDAPPPSSLGPSGFPAIEGIIWPLPVPEHADSARLLADAMRPAVARLRGIAIAIYPTDAQVIELTRLELVRVSTLGIAGFDAPRTGAAMRECADALESMRGLYSVVGQRWPLLMKERAALDSTLRTAVVYLRSHADFASFDRFAYLVGYGEPAARALDALRRAVHTTPISMPRGLRADAVSPYAADAFDARAYAARTTPRATPALVALGRRLFFDKSLSGARTRSCASCHHPGRAFTDGVSRAASVDVRGGLVTRNTPTLINAALQPAQFADARAVTLEDQVIEVLRSPAEMGSSIERATSAVRADSSYREQFVLAFADTSSETVTPLRVRQALAAFVRTLSATHARFDRAVRGDTTLLSATERHGFNLFMGKAGCGTCHFAPLFSGSTPPLYVGSDVEVIGTPVSPRRPTIPDPDKGRARIDQRPEHVRAFKTPSLRNVAVTAPYMHNGAFRTLDEVMRFYDAGGGLGSGAPIPNQTLSADSLHLSAVERSAIIAFLHSLTDTVFVH